MRATVFAAACLALVLVSCTQSINKYQSMYTGQKLTTRSDKAANELGGVRSSEYNTDLPEIRPFNLDTAKFSGGGECNPSGAKNLMDSANESALCRNRLAEHLVGLSNDMCAYHKVRIHANAALMNTSTTFLASTLGGIGALVTGSDVSRILSGSAGMTTALHSNINENVFQNQLASAILKQIDNQREAKLKDLRAHANEDTKAYPAERMVADAIEYNNLCSFSEALANLGNEAKRPATKDEIRGQIQMLRAEIKDNNDMIAKMGNDSARKDVQELLTANAALAKRIASLEINLSPEASSSKGAASPAAQ